MLSDVEILGQIEDGNIVIEPFKQTLLNSNSYDVRLGNWVARQRKDKSKLIHYNTSDGELLLWDEPEDVSKRDLFIYPQETVLCHTEEFIGGKNIITTEMRAKSTTGRYGLSVCKCAGLGDVGFVSRWTMEMTNHTSFIIKIPVGEPIAQIIFHLVGRTEKQYKGRYGQEAEWTPRDMIPRVKKHE